MVDIGAVTRDQPSQVGTVHGAVSFRTKNGSLSSGRRAVVIRRRLGGTHCIIVQGMEAQNPLVPQGYDIAWSVAAVSYLVLIVIAVVSLSRTAPRMSPWLALVWAALILVVPFLGPVAWLAVGRRTVPGERLPR